MKTTLKRICSIAVVFALILSLTGGYIDLFAQAAVYDNGDPFAAMYDCDALVNMKLKALNEHYAELEAQGAATQSDTSTVFGISGANAVVETKNSLHEKFARMRAEDERRTYESLTPNRYIIKYCEGSTVDISSTLRGRVQRTERLQDKSLNVRSGRNRNQTQGRVDNDRHGNSSRIEVITLIERVNPKTLADELRQTGADREIEYIQPDVVLSLESIFDPENESGSDDDSDEETDIDIDGESENTDDELDNGFADETDDTGILPYLPVTREGSVIVAVIDTGIDSAHPALHGYMAEGWNFPSSNSITYDPSYPLASAHGTHIAGTIAETAREYGADIKIMPLQVFENGTAYTSDILAAIEFAADNGVSVINCSFGSTKNNPALEDAIANTTDILFVASAGNSRSDLDTQPIYPAAYRFDNLISVGSVNADSGFSYFSNYSMNLVDVTAFGRDVQSALPEGEYGLMSGTSMAAAQVSGTAAVLAARDNIDSSELRASLLNGADSLANLQSKVNGGRRLNVNNAVQGINGQRLSLNAAADFDVHGYSPTTKEQWELFAVSKVVQVAAGNSHSLALREDGTVWAWGYNWSGQLGDGTSDDSNSPVQVIGITGIIAIAAGYDYSMALKSDGTVWTWGDNNWGKLGDGTDMNSSIPIQVSGLTGITAIAAGHDHSLAVKSSNTVWAWGYNEFGQLGNGSYEESYSPVQVSGLTGISDIAAGDLHSIAVKTDGTVFAWGWNGGGNLGDGSITDKRTPVQVNNLTGITHVEAGQDYSLALKADKTVWAWGQNYYGQLGDGTYFQRTTPVQINSLADVALISAGLLYNNYVVKTDGTVWSWGWNTDGQLGDGTTNDSNCPTKAVSMTNVISVSGGFYHGLAANLDGSVWAWGWNGDGQLGDGTFNDRQLPVLIIGTLPVADSLVLAINPQILQIPELDTTAQSFLSSTLLDQNGLEVLSSGIDYSLDSPYEGVSVDAITGEITVASDAQPGTVTFKASYNGLTATAELILTETPTNAFTFELFIDPEVIQIPELDKTSEAHLTAVLYDQSGVELTGNPIAFELESQYGGVIVNAEDGTVTVTSDAEPGIAVFWAECNGLTATAELQLTITPTEGIPNKAEQIVAGDYCSLVLDPDGSVWAWGLNNSGQLGSGTTAMRELTPIKVNGLENVIAIAGGGNHNLALKDDGTVVGWGMNTNGQLGSGTTSPRQVTPVHVAELTNVVAIAAGKGHSLALKDDGTVWAWGQNSYGQLGNGTTVQKTVPIQVNELTDIIAIAAGSNHSLALKEDGTVWAWGFNADGELGDGTKVNKTTPVQVEYLASITSISAGYFHSIALSGDGTVWTWGLNSNGQLGDGSTVQKSLPVRIDELADVTAIAAGGSHSIVLQKGGYVWTWGLNSNGQLGDGSRTQKLMPMQVNELSEIISITAGFYHSLALNSDGAVFAWGLNSNGQLGDGTQIDKTSPVQVMALPSYTIPPVIEPEPPVIDPDLDIPEELGSEPITDDLDENT